MVSQIRTLVLFSMLMTVANVSLAQRTTATFAGIVQDSTGAVLPGVDASLTNEGTSVALHAVTNETGEFLIDFVPPGTYTLKLSLPGFKGYESRSIPLGAAQSVRRWAHIVYGSGVSVGMPPNGVGVSVTPNVDSNQRTVCGDPE